MRLHLLGTGGYHPTERRHTACLMIPEAGVVLDAGTGMFRAAKLLETATLDVFLTHAHLDHVVGLTFLLGLLRGRSMDRVTVHGEPDKIAAIERHLLDEAIFPAKLPLEFRPLAPDEPLASGGRLRHFPVEHPGGAVGFRLDWPGHSMAYVTDTIARGATSAYLDSIRGVNLLVHEGYFPDSQCDMAELTGHSCATPVAELAKAAGVGHLILVHCDPSSDLEDPIGIETVRKVFPRAELARDQMIVEF